MVGSTVQATLDFRYDKDPEFPDPDDGLVKLRAVPRLIIQVDLVPLKCKLGRTNGIATVDLCLLDEFESILRQMARSYPPHVWNALT